LSQEYRTRGGTYGWERVALRIATIAGVMPDVRLLAAGAPAAARGDRLKAGKKVSERSQWPGRCNIPRSMDLSADAR
jgi:hypothetical protein